MLRRVVVTGLGLVTPLGLDVKSSWSAILDGTSGIKKIESFDVSQFSTRIAGSIPNFDVTQYLTVKEARKMDTFIHYGIAAATQAIEQSGLVVTPENADRIAVAVGAGIGGLPGIEKGHATFLKSGPRRISPFFVPSNIINMVAGHISIRHGFKGANFSVVSACATGSHNIGEGMRSIQYGDADVVVAGGAEQCCCPTGLGGFAAARALSSRNDDPEAASRPWDIDRDGFVLSDGAGVMVIEELEHAKARGANILGELIGYGKNSDAYHITSPVEDGEGGSRCIDLALKDAKINPSDVDYINAHGTSTVAGDVAETQAIKRSFGDYAKLLPVSSTKSMTGHMLGATGSAEAIFSILALRDQVLPPTINLTNPDPQCDLDYIADGARPQKVSTIMTNSFGFGGTNSCLIFRAY